MRRRPHVLSTALSAALVGGLLSPVPAAAQEDPALTASSNMAHVANLPYDLAYPDVEELPYGTDIEFAQLGGGEPGELRRLAGPERIATAAAVSADVVDSADTVLIATSEVYADALAAGPLAASLGAPVLLARPDGVPTATLAEIARLGADSAVLLGGTAALGTQVEADLADAGVTARRVGGANRFATAALVAEEVGVGDEVLVSVGEAEDPADGWRTALTASALGSAHDLPLLLINGSRLPQETADLLDQDVDVVLAAADGEVDPAVAAAIDDAAGTVTTIGGDGPITTSAALAAESVDRGADPQVVHVATTSAFADGLVAGAAAGLAGGVLHLVDGGSLAASGPSRDAIAAASPTLIRVAGGEAAVSAAVAEDLRALLSEGGAAGEYAIAGSEFNGLQIVDITDPEAAEIVAVYDCGILQGDVQVFDQGDGRTYATYTSENSASTVVESRCVQDAIAAGDVVLDDPEDKTPAYGSYVVEITDPTNPVYAGFIPVPEGSHNGTVHPSGAFFYNSDSALIDDTTPQIQVYDISDLTDVQRVGEVDLPVRPGLGTSSHDITFNADATRMYSAALSQTIIYDVTDPAAPVEISSFIDPAINVEHQADPIDVVASDGTERTLLIVEDELAGAAGNGFCPGGGMHVYDVTGDNEQNPMANKVGTYFIPEFRPAGPGSGQESVTCTAHVFRMYPEQQIMTIAWYNAGVWVLDLSGLADAAQNPLSQPIETLGFAYFDNSDTWSFKTNRFEEDGSFYAYGNDILRGLDVYRFDASVDATDDVAAFQGTWMNQAGAVSMASRAAAFAGLQQDGVAGLDDQALPRCLLAVDRR